ncbi:MAG: hypothetical protein H0T93_05265 [Chloroflexia bacterium]|nr:hypothetical protein [Chloroflexia bacterium]
MHANGVTGIAGVTVAVSSKADAEPLYRSLLGAPDSTGAPTRFYVGDQFVDLVDSNSGVPEVDGFVSSRGSGPFEVTLRGPDPVPGFPANLTHSARFTVECDASI